MAPDLALDAEVRRADEDRWLASRFAPADVRARLIALYALNHEIARTADTVTQAAIGDIRLQWWREGVDAIFDGGAAHAHPALAAFALAHRETPFSRATLSALIDARGMDLDPAPFTTWADVETYLDATTSGLLRLAVKACGAHHVHDALIGAAGRAWGYTGLLRAAPALRAKNRAVLPKEDNDPHALVARAQAAHAEARRISRNAPSAIFPALGYVALAPLYLRALNQGRTDVSLLRRQITLVAASATGAL